MGDSEEGQKVDKAITNLKHSSSNMGTFNGWIEANEERRVVASARLETLIAQAKQLLLDMDELLVVVRRHKGS